MATPEAIKRAKENYRKKTFRVMLEIPPSEEDIIKKLESVPSKQKYIKDLIRADIKKKDTQ
jgi:hypothetical protein